MSGERTLSIMSSVTQYVTSRSVVTGTELAQVDGAWLPPFLQTATIFSLARTASNCTKLDNGSSSAGCPVCGRKEGLSTVASLHVVLRFWTSYSPLVSKACPCPHALAPCQSCQPKTSLYISFFFSPQNLTDRPAQHNATIQASLLSIQWPASWPASQ